MQSKTATEGVIYGLAAYFMWGFAPIYFKSISFVPAGEILSHRIIWSCLFLVLLLAFRRHWSRVRSVLAQPKVLGILCCTSLLIASNWLVFIWAVSVNRMLDASLGYYINPLLNVVLGMLFLGETFRARQWWAIGLALTGVLVQVLAFGKLPWVALYLAASFGFYGLLRKKVGLGALEGLFIETMMLVPVALAYLFFFANSPTAQLSDNAWSLNALLMSAGLITTLPLLAFAAAAMRLRLSTIGFLQYIGPTLMFLLAVGMYGEPLETHKLITFGFIWVALIVFSLDAARHQHKLRTAQKQQA